MSFKFNTQKAMEQDNDSDDCINEDNLRKIGFVEQEFSDDLFYLCQEKDSMFAKKSVYLVYCSGRVFMEIRTSYHDKYGVKESADLQAVPLKVDTLNEITFLIFILKT